MSLTIGILGAHSRLASVIIDALLARGHTIIVLGRSQNPSLEIKGVTVRIVDYASIPSLTAGMNGVHTLLSFIFSLQEPVDSLVQTNCNILAAAQSAGVKRFAPSEWSHSYEANKAITSYKAKARFREEKLLKGDIGMEHTAFRPGNYMNLLAAGSPKLNAQGAMDEAFARAIPFAHIVDIEHATATIPGTGDEPVSFTRTQDIAAFVAAAIELKEPWPVELGMAGDVLSWNKVVEIAESVTGKKIERTYISIEEIEKKLQKGEWENPKEQMVWEANWVYAKGLQSSPPVLNRLVDVKPWGVERFLRKWWGQDES